MDAIALLKADHKAVEEKFVMFSALGNRAFKAKAKIVREVIAALTKHAAIEEALFYPAARERLQDSGYLVLDCQAFGAHPPAPTVPRRAAAQRDGVRHRQALGCNA